MKRHLLLVALFALPTSLPAQTPLPYTTGFDSPSQKQGWTMVRHGAVAGHGFGYAEDYMDGYVPTSAPNCLQHPSGLFNDPDVLSVDEAISPLFDFTDGGELQFSFNVFTFGGAWSADSIQVILRSNGTDYLLADLISLEHNSRNLRDTTLPIPAVPGNGRLVFRYTTFNNWYAVAFDDITVLPGTNNIGPISRAETFEVAPNPAGDFIQWSTSGIKSTDKVEILDLSGKVLQSVPFPTGRASLMNLPGGIYLIRFGNQQQRFIRK